MMLVMELCERYGLSGVGNVSSNEAQFEMVAIGVPKF